MRNDTGVEISALRVDGGASANDYLMQFQADILGVPVERPVIRETTALGAAYLAALAVDALTIPTIKQQWKVEKRFEPLMKSSLRASLYSRWQEAVDRSRNWARD
jgi:glycerol kinase